MITVRKETPCGVGAASSRDPMEPIAAGSRSNESRFLFRRRFLKRAGSRYREVAART